MLAKTHDEFLKNNGEQKWQKFWEENKTNHCDLQDKTKPKFYNLVMFFYPSGAKIHIGHGYNYTGSDVYGRYKTMRGFNVFEPMGADAFGLPAENYAIKTGVHPAITTKENVDFGMKQLKSLGTMYDWEKEINTSDPEYYKWTQWLFSVLYKAGLAYRKEAPVNWCTSCKTVLANEQVISGKCERCNSQVVQKNLKQWFFKITNYADRLLKGHKKINWPEKTITMQKNWIGRSEGAEIIFNVNDYKLKVFTTRPDTLFGATFMVIAPEHQLISNFQDTTCPFVRRVSNFQEVKKYIQQAKNKSDLERSDLNKNKSGVELKGIKAINPVNNQEIPIFVADYVMMNYGTGAIMAVPAHDQRDYDFAKKYDLKIIEVIKGGDITKQAFTNIDSGEMINSGFLNGMIPKDAINKIIKYLEDNNLGKKTVQYKLRDWLISRQRYWGAPIPIIFCEKCGEVLDENLPIKLPNLENFAPTDDGHSPLARSKEFVNIKCPKCNSKAKRCTETMDTFVCSSWYFLRFLSPNLKNMAFDKALTEKWLPVDQYCGGAEHACMHLLYARFITKVLYDQKYINFDEPFIKLNHQGMILATDGTKMSKSKGNVVIPDDYIKKYGADVFRTYVLFLAPFEEGGSWNDNGILGVKRFFNRIWKLHNKTNSSKTISNNKFTNLFHQTIKKVTQDIENFHFNTAISQMMILLNEIDKQSEISTNTYKTLLLLLAPFAPHLTEELWHNLGYNQSIYQEKWPAYNPELIKNNEIELVVQVNGKVRDKFLTQAGIPKDQSQKTALKSEKIKRWLKSKEPKKIIFIQDKLINIVT